MSTIHVRPRGPHHAPLLRSCAFFLATPQGCTIRCRNVDFFGGGFLLVIVCSQRVNVWGTRQGRRSARLNEPCSFERVQPSFCVESSWLPPVVFLKRQPSMPRNYPQRHTGRTVQPLKFLANDAVNTATYILAHDYPPSHALGFERFKANRSRKRRCHAEKWWPSIFLFNHSTYSLECLWS